jgi:phosphoribosylformylglycinamidine cyclo-ligase
VTARPARVTEDAYRRAGVDVAAAEIAVERIRERAESTFGGEVLTSVGSFAAGVAMPAGTIDPVLVSATDGVGTKTAIATALGRFDTIGIDLVAMCADDVVCLGARPLFFLDYLAVEHLDPDQVATIVGGVSRGCHEAECSLVGGETAEHPGVLPIGGFDLAGFCVGIAERGDLFAEPTARPGDAIVGIAANGLHANGFSLVRMLVADHELDLATPYSDLVEQVLGGAPRAGQAGGTPVPADAARPDATFGEVLLTPTPIYAPHLLALRAHLRSRDLAVRGYAHITGGGLPGNVPRALPDTLAARLDPERWPAPSILSLLAAVGDLEGREMRAVFNGGLGMVAIVEASAAAPAIEFLADRGLAAWLVGEVVPRTDDERYQEGPLSWTEG